jgi:hypothetical protein
MRKTLIIAALASATALAFPAAAQPDYGRGYGYGHNYPQSRNIERQIRDYDANIRNSVRLGRLSPRAGDRLLRQLDRIREIYFDYRRGGLSPREHVELRDRLNHFRQRLVSAGRHDRRWDERDRYDDDRRGDRRDRRWDRDDDDRDDDDD